MLVNKCSRVRLDEVDGVVESYSSDNPFSEPLMKHPIGRLGGYVSGGRSAVAEIDGGFYKIKGCGYGSDGVDFKKRWVYEEAGDEQPLGSMTRTQAMKELDNIRMVNEIFRHNGIRSCARPVARFDYNQNEWDEGVSAAIFEIESDLRADTFLFNLNRMLFDGQLSNGGALKGFLDDDRVLMEFEINDKDLENSVGIFYEQFGRLTGNLLGYLHKNGLCWGVANANRTQSHLGNVIVYDLGGHNLMLGLTDFDRIIAPSGEPFKQNKTEEKNDMIKHLVYPILFSHMDGKTQLPKVPEIPESCKVALKTGFEEGYEGDSFEPVNFGYSDRINESVRLVLERFDV